MRALSDMLARPSFTVPDRLNRFEGHTAADLATRSVEKVPFFGERPGISSGLVWHEDGRQEFTKQRPEHEDAHDLLYSSSGKAWKQGRLIARYSTVPISPEHLFDLPPSTGVQVIEQGTIVEVDFSYSYGDWVHCCLGTILAARQLLAPLIVPKALASRDYVRRDLAVAGIDYVVVESWVHIRKARILRKRNPKFYWKSADVKNFQRTFVPNRVAPDPGSILYLGQFNLAGETISRNFPSDRVAAALAPRCSKVVHQANLTTETASAYSKWADSVIGDHGSGLLKSNVLEATDRH